MQPESLSPLDRRLALFSALTALVIVVFFSLDELLGAIPIKTVYLSIGPLVQLLLVGVGLALGIGWKSPLLLFVIVALLPVLYALWENVGISWLVVTLLGIGIFTLLPVVVVASVVIFIIGVIRREWRAMITHPVFTHSVTLLILLATIAYIFIVLFHAFVQRVVSYQALTSHTYYLSEWDILSSDVSAQIRLFECNSLSIDCREIYRVRRENDQQRFQLTHSEDKLIIVIDGQPAKEIPVGAG